MAQFLSTTATSYHLEELIKTASDRLILISPFLKVNARIKELHEDKNRLKIDVRIVYGKNELQPAEINWLSELTYVRTSFCQNLHAKCYMNENHCIITSLNLYEFSQVNNNEMGVFICREKDHDVYRDAYDEAQRIVRISDEIRISAERISGDGATPKSHATSKPDDGKLSTSKLAKLHNLKTADFLNRLVDHGYLASVDENHELTSAGKEAGGELKQSRRFGPYFLWPRDLSFQNGEQ